MPDLLFLMKIFVSFYIISCISSKQFDDSILFRLHWPGDGISAPEDLLEKYDKKSLTLDEAVVLSSIDNEKYICALPKSSSSSSTRKIEYFGPSPQQLIKPLYDQRTCTYRIEIYWTYELCHGQYLLQYHEEKDGHRRVSRQEYYLGQFIPEMDPNMDKPNDYSNPPKRKVDDQMLPYYSVRYSQGTICDISQKPRQTEIHYVCDPDGKNQIYSLDEVSSCEYEIVVLTPKLCTHPSFRTETQKENPLECYPLNGSPPKPTSLTVWEKELNWEERATQKNLILPSVPNYESAGKKPAVSSNQQTNRGTPASTMVPRSPMDLSLEQSFLNGDYCLYGGVGWWKHEYCHYKQVVQYHEDEDMGRTEILLGKWDKQEHLKWIQTKPHKKPVKVEGKILQATHFYSNGDLCDISLKPRTVEVRVKCKETPMSPDAVTLYLLEPKSCEYILGVESQIFCEILQSVDENGLFPDQPEPAS